ncbi:transmembrane protein [Caballeronia choica]|uniref:Transmembrane protein n=1 Tax=Caballeronia choica TaxID=326476 RepID=A0A158J2V2_9BURK|nr:FimV/HubP family polar landmark protein [Caballeronia choica]SAL63178.1 transmembrane protein [Caballeronia choica]
MTFRPHRAFAPSVRIPRVALAALGAACVIFGANPGDARAQASDASAASATAAGSSAGGAQYAVKPGQSLGDIASELTGSKDRATREKMARALFDANPGAFMGHDPSRLKLGSVLTVPAVDLGGVASGAASASAAAVTAGSAPAPALAPAPATNEAAAPGETASVPSGAQSTEPATGASEPHVVGGAIQASTAPATSAASEASTELGASAGLPGSAATSTATPAAASTSNSTMIVAGIGVLIVALVLFLRSRRRRAPASDTVARETTPPSALAPGVANLDSASVQRGEGELNAVAASMEDYDAAQSFDTPTDDERLPADDARHAASPTVARVTDAQIRETVPQPAAFVPEAPSTGHRDFVPPLRTVGAMEAEADAREADKRKAEAREADVRESEARETASREEARAAEAWEEARAQDTRAAEARDAETPQAAEHKATAFETPANGAAAHEEAAREAAAHEAAAHEAAAHEAAGHEAAAREAAYEAAAREATAHEAATQEAAAQEAAAQEAAAHEAAAQEAPTQKAAPEADEASAHETTAQDSARAVEAQRTHTAQALDHPSQSPAPREPAAAPTFDTDDEPTPASRLPKPRFPREAIEALDSLGLGLPPRRGMPAASSAPSPVTPQPLVEPTTPSHARDADTQPPITPEPVKPQPVAEPGVLRRQSESVAEPAQLPSAATEIEAGTSGPASVAGLGAPSFGPMSLEFSLDLPSNHTDPLPAFTAEQIATIAHNKLELAAEYIDLGDLSGARTLLQEVLDSNDPATYHQAAALLSTLAPHS